MTVKKSPGAGQVRPLDKSPLEQAPNLANLTGRFAPAPGIAEDPAIAAQLAASQAVMSVIPQPVSDVPPVPVPDPTPARDEPIPAVLVEGEPVYLTPGETLIYNMVSELVDAVNLIGQQQQWVTQQVNGFVSEGVAQLRGGGIAGIMKMVAGIGGK